MASPENAAVTYREEGRVAIITLNRPTKLNALSRAHFFRVSSLLRAIADNPKISITVITGTGRFFSAGVDMTLSSPSLGDKEQERRDLLMRFGRHNLNLTYSFYTHPKILVAALNGPAIGISAALLGFCDFIYATPHTYLLTPFSSLGLVTEGGASFGLVQRMGISKANEALVMSRKIPCEELVQCSFVNKVFRAKDENDSEDFLRQVLAEVDDRLGAHLNQSSILKIKHLIRRPYIDTISSQTLHEVVEGVQRFIIGEPQEEFRKISTRQKRHKL